LPDAELREALERFFEGTGERWKPVGAARFELATS
jgi:hypothetical protein